MSYLKKLIAQRLPVNFLELDWPCPKKGTYSPKMTRYGRILWPEDFAKTKQRVMNFKYY